jgi:hypothetical protein
MQYMYYCAVRMAYARAIRERFGDLLLRYKKPPDFNYARDPVSYFYFSARRARAGAV